jgi:imidazolonepropionase-like amidohydrolase
MKPFLADVVVTGVDRRVITAGAVLVDDVRRVGAVGVASEVAASPGAADAARTDLGPSTLLPGLFDSDVHLGFFSS